MNDERFSVLVIFGLGFLFEICFRKLGTGTLLYFFCIVFYLNWNILFSQFKDRILIKLKYLTPVSKLLPISSSLKAMKTFQNQWLCTYILSFLASFLQKWPQCTVKSAKISFIVQQPLRETLVCLCRNRKFSKGHKYLPLWALAKLVWASRIADDVANFFLEPSLDQEVYRHQVHIFLSFHANMNFSF